VEHDLLGPGIGAEKDRDCAGDIIVKSWGKVILDNLVVELQGLRRVLELELFEEFVLEALSSS